MDAKFTCNSSFIWRSLCWGRECLRLGLRWRIKNGRSVRVFHDAWIPAFSSGKLLMNYGDDMNLKVADLLNSDNQWNKELLESLFLPVEVEAILSVPRDSRYWRYAENGMFSVKSGYLCLLGFYQEQTTNTSSCYDKWWKGLWKLKLPPKVKVFAWRLMHGFLPVDERLKSRHVPVQETCSWCHYDTHAISHCLIFCDAVKNMWKSTIFWDSLKSWRLMLMADICRRLFEKLNISEFEVWIILLWRIWAELCQIKHGQSMKLSTNIIDFSEHYLESFRNARKMLMIQNRLFPMVGSKVWKKPPCGKFRMDVDVSFTPNARLIGIGIIIRDHRGEVILAMARQGSPTQTVLMGELAAIWRGVNTCIEQGYTPVMVFSDSILAVRALDDNDGYRSTLCKDLIDKISVGIFPINALN